MAHARTLTDHDLLTMQRRGQVIVEACNVHISEYTKVMSSGKTVTVSTHEDSRVPVFIHPKLDTAHKFLAKSTAEYFPTLETHGVSVKLVPEDEDLGEISAGGNHFIKAGHYDSAAKQIVGKVEPGLLAHEMGHAELDYGLEQRKRGLQDLSMDVQRRKAMIDDDKEGQSLRADDRIRTPKDARQEVHNNAIMFENSLRDDAAHASDYSKSWRKETIYDGPAGVEHPVGYEEGKPYGGRESLRLMTAVPRHVNEAYAEFSRGHVLTDMKKRGILESIPSQYEFKSMGNKESRDAFLALRKSIHAASKL